MQRTSSLASLRLVTALLATLLSAGAAFGETPRTSELAAALTARAPAQPQDEAQFVCPHNWQSGGGLADFTAFVGEYLNDPYPVNSKWDSDCDCRVGLTDYSCFAIHFLGGTVTTGSCPGGGPGCFP